MGFALGEDMNIAPGTPDREAAERIEAFSMDLLLVPFHLYRDKDGNAVDGIGVLQALSGEFNLRKVPMIMPVSTFSLNASFPPRFAELETTRPEILSELVVMPEDEIGSDEIGAKLHRLMMDR